MPRIAAKTLIRCYHQNQAHLQSVQTILHQSRTKAWQIHSYGDISELQLGARRTPALTKPNEVLVQVEAASVNPIDVMMLGGYGRTLFQVPRMGEMELPLTLGRDFCGNIVSKGQLVTRFQIGDAVYGFVPLHKQGSFAQLVVADQNHICPKPDTLTAIESASLVYATMTAWSALFLFGNLALKQVKGTKVLVLGASGGVGTAAVQLLKSQNCIVFGSCSTDAVPLVRSLGADAVYDYNDPGFAKNVEQEFYHIILDCAKFGHENVPKSWKYSRFITLNSPLLSNTDKYGLCGGLLSSASTWLQSNLQSPADRKCVKWGFFVPSGSGLNFIHSLISQGKIRPLVHKEFTFDCLQEAFREVQKGNLRGKVVVTM